MTRLVHIFGELMTLRNWWKQPQRTPGQRLRRSSIRRCLSLLLVGSVGLSLLVVQPLSYANLPLAQISLPSASPSETTRPPAGVERFGDIEVAPVTLNGENLFKVVAPTVRDRKNAGNQTPVEVRAEAIEANLQRVIVEEQPEAVRAERGYSTTFDPETFEVQVVSMNGQTVIVAKDAYREQPLELVTVTEPDASYYGLSVAKLAAQWQATIQRKLSKELSDRQPERFEKKITLSIGIALATLLTSGALLLMQRFLAVRDRLLKMRQAKQATKAVAVDSATPNAPEAMHTVPLVEATNDTVTIEAPPAIEPPTTLPAPSAPKTAVFSQGRILRTLKNQFTLTRRRRVISALRWLVGWGQIMVWLVGVAFILQQFPATRQIGVGLLEVPIFLLLVWFVVGLMDWIGDLLIDRASMVWEDEHFSRFPLFAIEDAQRKSLRISTTIRALRGLKTFLISCFGLGLALQTLGVPIASVLTGGAIIAFGISLAFQNLLKDLINGCLILWEDQYGIGDVVAIDGASGLVENMNLRITQLRDAEGRLITIPNSTITKVENLTRTWSRVNLDVEVDYNADVEHVFQVIRDMAQQMYQEPEWRDRILEMPEILGIDRLSSTGMLIRIWIKTQPSQQWLVGREFRRRLRHILGQNQIPIGVPKQALQAEDDRFFHANGHGSREDSSRTQPASGPKPRPAKTDRSLPDELV